MKQQVLFFAVAGILSFSGAVAQTNPAPFDLSTGDYNFDAWQVSSAAGTFPEGLAFHVSDQDKPDLIYTPLTGDWHCGYNLDSRPRFLGLNNDGIAFLNTGSAQYDNCVDGDNTRNVYVGGVVLGLNTTGLDSAFLEYDIQLLTVGDGGDPGIPRHYAVRLQARANTTDNFQDVDPVVEITSEGNVAGASEHQSLKLPAELLNQANVQYRWLYYDKKAAGSGGTRPKYRLDNIRVSKVTPQTGIALQASADKRINVHPNPVLKGNVLALSAPVTGGIYNLAGRLVLELNHTSVVETVALTPGMYYIRTQEGNAIRFIVR